MHRMASSKVAVPPIASISHGSLLPVSSSSCSSPPLKTAAIPALPQNPASAARFSHLESSALNLMRLRQEERRCIFDLLQRFVGTKVLVLERRLLSFLNALVDVSELRENGVESWREIGYYPLRAAQDHVIFLCSADILLMQQVSYQISFLEREIAAVDDQAARQGEHGRKKAEKAGGISSIVGVGGFSSILQGTFNTSSPTSTLRHSTVGGDAGDAERSRKSAGKNTPNVIVAFVPIQLECCIHELRKKNLAIDICFTSCPLYFVPYDYDLLSLELKYTLRDFHGYGDTANLAVAVQSIIHLQKMTGGSIPHIRAIGSAARYVVEQLVRYRREHAADVEAENIQSIQEICAAENGGEVPPVKYIVPPEEVDEEEENGSGGGYASWRSSRSAAGEECGIKKGEAYLRKQVVNGLYCLLEEEREAKSEEEEGYSCIDYLILIDRKVDLATPLCTAFTYEGLLDYIFNINSSCVEVPVEIISGVCKEAGGRVEKEENVNSLAALKKGKKVEGKKVEGKKVEGRKVEGKKTKVCLGSNDSLYRKIRNLHITEIGQYLHKKANEINEAYKEKDNLKTVAELNQFVKKFTVYQSEHQSLAPHVNLASYISNRLNDEEMINLLRIEDEILQSAVNGSIKVAACVSEIVNWIEGLLERGSTPLHEVYRLLCLLSIVSNGVKSSLLDQVKRSIVQTHGFQEIHKMLVLERIGLLRPQQSASSNRGFYDLLNKHFHLLLSESEMMDDISYVCSGYAPLSVRLVQLLFALSGGWRDCADALNLLHGPALEVRQQRFVAAAFPPHRYASLSTPPPPSLSTPPPPSLSTSPPPFLSPPFLSPPSLSTPFLSPPSLSTPFLSTPSLSTPSPSLPTPSLSLSTPSCSSSHFEQQQHCKRLHHQQNFAPQANSSDDYAAAAHHSHTPSKNTATTTNHQIAPLSATAASTTPSPITKSGEHSPSSSAIAPKPTIVLVMFLGGVTYSEIAALRKLSAIEGGLRKYIVITTEFINFKSWDSTFSYLYYLKRSPPHS